MNRKKLHLKRHAQTIIAIGAIFFIGVVLCFAFRENIRDGYEVASSVFAPNAERDFAYGERHLNASSNPQAYNLDLAEYFFWQAQKLDPMIPYLYHEIARVDFLRGNFTKALDEINLQIENQGDNTPNSYYVRGLIEGYMGDYTDAARDYAHFLQFDPYNWAGLNDYAWVLLKAGRSADAAAATSKGLSRFPNNPWLLNSNVIALYEIGDIKDARTQAQKAVAAVASVTTADWLHSYPGNDPAIAQEGIASLKEAATNNMHMVDAATTSHGVQFNAQP
ncbi:MAG TPA: hypothetical protein VMU25_03875 [Candidatus Paceibacterota bacterium]|nr:hypothetical protein [Candidatus Paceibacterota bacterium]